MKLIISKVLFCDNSHVSSLQFTVAALSAFELWSRCLLENDSTPRDETADRPEAHNDDTNDSQTLAVVSMLTRYVCYTPSVNVHCQILRLTDPRGLVSHLTPSIRWR